MSRHPALWSVRELGHAQQGRAGRSADCFYQSTVISACDRMTGNAMFDVDKVAAEKKVEMYSIHSAEVM